MNGKLLIFINTKRSCQELCDQLRAPPYGCVVLSFSRRPVLLTSLPFLFLVRSHSVVSLHGDKLQEERNFVLNEFRLGTSPILCATDVAQRGLDIDAITVVLNFDTPQNIEDYVHRIGRTGRAGKEGRAITFLNDRQDAAIAGAIMDVMNRAQQVIPEELINLAGESSTSFFPLPLPSLPTNPTSFLSRFLLRVVEQQRRLWRPTFVRLCAQLRSSPFPHRSPSSQLRRSSRLHPSRRDRELLFRRRC